MDLCESKRHSLRDIINITHVPKSTIEDIKKRGIEVSKPRAERSKKLSQQKMHRIIDYICINRITRRLTLTKLIQILNLDIHKNTLRTTLKEISYNRKVARHCPFLNEHDRLRKLEFARKHLH